jgi:hypothetical protein
MNDVSVRCGMKKRLFAFLCALYISVVSSTTTNISEISRLSQWVGTGVIDVRQFDDIVVGFGQDRLFLSQIDDRNVVSVMSSISIPFDNGFLEFNPDICDIQGGYLYVVDQVSGTYLRIYDIADITNPVPLATMEFPVNIYAIEEVGDYLYCEIGNEMKVICISNPTEPTIVGSVNPVEYCTYLESDGTHLYGLGDHTNRLDLTNPVSPVVSASSPYGITGGRIFFKDNAVIVTSYHNIYSLDPNDLHILFQFEQPESVDCFGPESLIGDYLYLLGYSSSQRYIIILDAHDQDSLNLVSDPLLVPYIDNLDFYSEMINNGDKIFLYEPLAGFTVGYDLMDPVVPIEIPVPFSRVNNICFTGDYIVSTGPGGMATTNVSNPIEPELSWSNTSCAEGFKMLNSYGFSTDGSQLYSWDFSSPEQPVLLDQLYYYVSGLYSCRLLVTPDSLCIIPYQWDQDDLSGYDVKLYDVSDPANIESSDTYPHPSGCQLYDEMIDNYQYFSNSVNWGAYDMGQSQGFPLVLIRSGVMTCFAADQSRLYTTSYEQAFHVLTTRIRSIRPS